MIVDPDAPRGDVLWEPDGARKGESNVASYTEFLRGHGIEPGQDYASLWQWSVAHPETFWSTWAEFSGVRMGGQDAAVRSSEPMPHTTWFPGRTVNFARHLLEGREGTAFITLSEAGDRAEISFSELRRRVAALAEHLASLGVGHGDVVAAILPNVVEAAIGLFATASLGAIWSICAPEFGSGAIISRFTQLKPKALIAAPGYRLSGKDRPRTTELAEVFASVVKRDPRPVWLSSEDRPVSDIPPVQTPVERAQGQGQMAPQDEAAAAGDDTVPGPVAPGGEPAPGTQRPQEEPVVGPYDQATSPHTQGTGLYDQTADGGAHPGQVPHDGGAHPGSTPTQGWPHPGGANAGEPHPGAAGRDEPGSQPDEPGSQERP